MNALPSGPMKRARGIQLGIERLKKVRRVDTHGSPGPGHSRIQDTAPRDSSGLPPFAIGQAPSPADSFREKVYLELNEDEADVIRGDRDQGTQSANEALRKTHELATRKQELCRSRRYIWTFRGRMIDMSVTVDDFVSCLKRIRAVGDILANASPVYAGMPWAGIRLLLETAISESQQMGALVSGLRSTLTTAQQLEAYSVFMLGLERTTATLILETTLIKAYANVLRFLVRSIHAFERKTVSRAYHSLFDNNDLSEYESLCGRLSQRVEDAASNCDRELAREDRMTLASLRNDLKDCSHGLHELQGLTASVTTLNTRTALAQLNVVGSAGHNSYDEENEPRCLEGTRISLLYKIDEWIEHPDREPIFWLHGAAGTGKSTIARTVARSLHSRGQLAASFFFKATVGERSSARHVLPTMAMQIAEMLRDPILLSALAEAVDDNPHISEKGLEEQFEMLLLRPLRAVTTAMQESVLFVFVIDALDECDEDGRVTSILRLLLKLNQLNGLCVRLFLTSRPERQERWLFAQMASRDHFDVALHEVPHQHIQDDISLFLKHELAGIRAQHNFGLQNTELAEDWPGEDVVKTLLERAVPLFVFAATICRFIGDPHGNPKKRLDAILKRPENSRMGNIYQPILAQLVSTEIGPDRDIAVAEIKELVATIIILTNPLSCHALSELLGIEAISEIRHRLGGLHSVLNVPVDDHVPIQLFHLSFRDCLLDPAGHHTEEFRINEHEYNEILMSYCLKLLSKPDILKQDICELGGPAVRLSSVRPETIRSHISPAVEYASRYWVYHLKRSHVKMDDESAAFKFLQKHLLHWIEVMAWLNRVNESVTLLLELSSRTQRENSRHASRFLEDAISFVRQCAHGVEIAPLQLYSSALIFSPHESIVKQTFASCLPQWTETHHGVHRSWDSRVLSLERHSREVTSLAFSPDSRLLASGSEGASLRIWDTATGDLLHGIAQSAQVTAVAFASDKTRIFTASSDGTIACWNSISGKPIGSAFQSRWTPAFLAVSADGRPVAAKSFPDGVRVWCPDTDEIMATLSDRSMLECIAISAQGDLLATSIAEDVTVYVIETGLVFETLKHRSPVWRMSFTSRSLVLLDFQGVVTCVDLDSGKPKIIPGIVQGYRPMTCCPNEHQLATIDDLSGKTITLHNIAQDDIGSRDPTEPQSPEGAGPPSGKQKTSNPRSRVDPQGSDVAALETARGNEKSSRVRSLAFSPDTQRLAAGFHGTILILDTVTGVQLHRLSEHTHIVTFVIFNHDGRLMASASSDTTICVWQPGNGRLVKKLTGHQYAVTSVAFSPIASLVASASVDHSARIWDVESGTEKHRLLGHESAVRTVAFSRDGLILATGSLDRTIRLWNVSTGDVLHTINRQVATVEFLRGTVPEPSDIRVFAEDSTTFEMGQHQYNCRLFWYNHGNVMLALTSDREDSDNTSAPSPDLASKDQPVLMNDFWVTWSGQDRLWLPPKYRPRVWVAHGARLALGQDDGSVQILTFTR